MGDLKGLEANGVTKKILIRKFKNLVNLRSDLTEKIFAKLCAIFVC